MTPDFSVIVPVYNVAPYLRECVDSILGQTCGELELLLVDDGSSDGSGAICDGCAAQDGRVQVIHQPNRGVVAARRAALDRAVGEYVCFVDGDDMVKRTWLETLRRCLSENGRPDMIAFGFTQTGGAPAQPRPAAPGYYDKARLEREVYPYMLWDRRRPFLTQLIPGYQWASAMRRPLAAAHFVQDPSLTVYEDTAMIYECLWNAESLYVCGEELYIYRQRDGSALNAYDPEELQKLKRCRDYLQGHLVRQAPAAACQVDAFTASKIMHAIYAQQVQGAGLCLAARRIAAGLEETGLARDLETEGLPPQIRLLMGLLRRRAYWLAVLVYRLRLWLYARRHPQGGRS